MGRRAGPVAVTARAQSRAAASQPYSAEATRAYRVHTIVVQQAYPQSCWDGQAQEQRCEGAKIKLRHDSQRLALTTTTCPHWPGIQRTLFIRAASQRGTPLLPAPRSIAACVVRSRRQRSQPRGQLQPPVTPQNHPVDSPKLLREYLDLLHHYLPHPPLVRMLGDTCSGTMLPSYSFGRYGFGRMVPPRLCLDGGALLYCCCRVLRVGFWWQR
jgi:hypothetical protein